MKHYEPMIDAEYVCNQMISQQRLLGLREAILHFDLNAL